MMIVDTLQSTRQSIKCLFILSMRIQIPSNGDIRTRNLVNVIVLPEPLQSQLP